MGKETASDRAGYIRSPDIPGGTETNGQPGSHQRSFRPVDPHHHHRGAVKEAPKAEKGTKEEKKEKKPRKPRAKKEEKPKEIEKPVCPICKKGNILRGKTAYGCSEYKNGCTFRLDYATYGEGLSDKELIEVIKAL